MVMYLMNKTQEAETEIARIRANILKTQQIKLSDHEIILLSLKEYQR